MCDPSTGRHRNEKVLQILLEELRLILLGQLSTAVGGSLYSKLLLDDSLLLVLFKTGGNDNCLKLFVTRSNWKYLQLEMGVLSKMWEVENFLLQQCEFIEKIAFHFLGSLGDQHLPFLIMTIHSFVVSTSFAKLATSQFFFTLSLLSKAAVPTMILQTGAQKSEVSSSVVLERDRLFLSKLWGLWSKGYNWPEFLLREVKIQGLFIEFLTQFVEKWVTQKRKDNHKQYHRWKKSTTWPLQSREDSPFSSTMSVIHGDAAMKFLLIPACVLPCNKDRARSLTTIARDGHAPVLQIHTTRTPYSHGWAVKLDDGGPVHLREFNRSMLGPLLVVGLHSKKGMNITTQSHATAEGSMARLREVMKNDKGHSLILTVGKALLLDSPSLRTRMFRSEVECHEPGGVPIECLPFVRAWLGQPH